MKQDKTPLTRSAFVSGFRAALIQAGYQNSETSRYSDGHSFKAGAASTAAALGMEDSLIKTLGCWESSRYLNQVNGMAREVEMWGR